MVGKLDETGIDRLLADQRFARLACHARGKTYVVPVSYVYTDGTLYGQTAEGLKIRMMRSNPEVCLEVDDIQSLTEWRSAVVWGRYEELEGMDAVEARGKLIDRFGPIFEEEYAKNRLGRSIAPERTDGKPHPEVVYAIHITEKTGRFERADG